MGAQHTVVVYHCLLLLPFWREVSCWCGSLGVFSRSAIVLACCFTCNVYLFLTLSKVDLHYVIVSLPVLSSASICRLALCT